MHTAQRRYITHSQLFIHKEEKEAQRSNFSELNRLEQVSLPHAGEKFGEIENMLRHIRRQVRRQLSTTKLTRNVTTHYYQKPRENDERYVLVWTACFEKPGQTLNDISF